MSETCNGNGKKGSGGPPADLLRRYHPGHTHKDLGKHILAGMYGGPGRNGVVHTGLTPELAQKIVSHTHKHITVTSLS